MDELKLIERLLDVLNDWDLSCSEEPELKLEIARQQAKVVQLLAATAVSNRRELLIGFKQWEIDNDIKNLLPEQMVDWYLEDEAN